MSHKPHTALRPLICCCWSSYWIQNASGLYYFEMLTDGSLVSRTCYCVEISSPAPFSLTLITRYPLINLHWQLFKVIDVLYFIASLQQNCWCQSSCASLSSSIWASPIVSFKTLPSYCLLCWSWTWRTWCSFGLSPQLCTNFQSILSESQLTSCFEACAGVLGSFSSLTCLSVCSCLNPLSQIMECRRSRSSARMNYPVSFCCLDQSLFKTTWATGCSSSLSLWSSQSLFPPIPQSFHFLLGQYPSP